MSELNTLLYHNKRQATLYFVSLLTLALSVFTCYMIFSDWDAFAAEYRSDLSAIGWAIFMLVTGNVMLGCMVWLSGRYILRIEQTGEKHVSIQTWSIIGMYKTRVYPLEMLRTAVFYKGVSNYPNAPGVVAPYSVLKTPNGKKLILDEANGGRKMDRVVKKKHHRL